MRSRAEMTHDMRLIAPRGPMCEQRRDLAELTPRSRRGVTDTWRRIVLNATLVPTVVSIEPLPELPYGLPAQPTWHADAMRRVASDALNLTGASLHGEIADIMHILSCTCRTYTCRRPCAPHAAARGQRS